MIAHVDPRTEGQVLRTLPRRNRLDQVDVKLRLCAVLRMWVVDFTGEVVRLPVVPVVFKIIQPLFAGFSHPNTEVTLRQFRGPP